MTLTEDMMDTTNTKNPTAKTFQEPLIKVLGDLSGFKANRPVIFNNTYQPICQMFNITIDQYGKQPVSDINWVERWIQFAFKDITNQGFGIKIGRGQWALSETGVQKALELAGKQGQVVQAIQDAIPSDVVSVNLVPNVSVAIGYNNVEDSYHFDPYIRFLALQEIGCKGYHSEQSSICSACTMQNTCKNIKATIFSDLAKQLDIEDKAALAPKTVIPAPTFVTPTVTNAVTGTKASGGTFQKINNQGVIPCGHCGKPINKGVECYWGKDASGAKKVYHLECYEPA
jgi:hypothetical protein